MKQLAPALSRKVREPGLGHLGKAMRALRQAPARILCRLCRADTLQYDRAVSQILITGASGFVGRALLPVLVPRHRLVLAQRRPGGQSAIADVEHRLVGNIGPETDW